MDTQRKKIIEAFSDCVVQIATPYTTGTGFYLKNYNVIVTNEHVVRKSPNATVRLSDGEAQLLEVFYLDLKCDLALLRLDHSLDVKKSIELSEQKAHQGDAVIAAGHPFGLKFTATQGIISNTEYIQDRVHYIQHDAALNPGNSGGPLINLQGHLIGINTFIHRSGQSMGFALPVSYLIDVLHNLTVIGTIQSARCPSCSFFVTEENIEEGYCPRCGTIATLPKTHLAYEPVGIAEEIEHVLSERDIHLELARRGLQKWSIDHGRLASQIEHDDRLGIIRVHTRVGEIPKYDVKALYVYILKQNNELQHVSLSVKNGQINLFFMLYSQYFDARELSTRLDSLLTEGRRIQGEIERRFSNESSQ